MRSGGSLPPIYAMLRLPGGEWIRVDRDPAELACVWRKRPMTQRSGSDRSRRVAGRARWHRWADRRRAGRATCRFEYDGAGLGKLILKGWLPRSDTYSSEAIGRAVTDLIAHGDLPRKIT